MIKIGDKVKITVQGHYNELFNIGDIVNVVGVAGGRCPYYLSKDKEMSSHRSNFFGPFASSYEKYIPKNLIGGKLL